MVDCSDCKGKGFVIKRVAHKSQWEPAWTLERLVCNTCKGTGEVSNSFLKMPRDSY